MTNQAYEENDDLVEKTHNNGLSSSSNPTNQIDLKKYIKMKQPSFTEAEKTVLHSLLIEDENGAVKKNHNSFLKTYLHDDQNVDWDLMERLLDHDKEKVLTDDMLFSVPIFEIMSSKNQEYPPPDKNGREESLLVPPRTRRDNSKHIGLWRAHEEGISPDKLRSHSKIGNSSIEPQTSSQTVEEKDGEETFRSDEEVRIPKDKNTDDDDTNSTASSWGLSDGGFDHYDAWGVLKDEYAQDFGFDYQERNTSTALESAVDDFVVVDGDDDDDLGTTFKILGTSADDVTAQPHVLSPPLMESLLSFLPESLSSGQNFWLKFSLVRDGASLETLLRYVRAAPNTIIAIETTNGNVFGSFTSSTWSNKRHHRGYYGTQQAFLWKMRHNRVTTPCYSLFDQASLESEIDVFMCSGMNDYIQLCTHDRIALGSGVLKQPKTEPLILEEGESQGSESSLRLYEMDEDGDKATDYGFGLAISSDLLHGTSSPCATFQNPSLCKDTTDKNNISDGGEVFEIVNLEVWSFTPCLTVEDAERLEMRKYFIQESVMSLASTSSTSHSRQGEYWSTYPSSSKSTSLWSASDLSQRDFYRRVGENDKNETNRKGWTYANNFRR